MGEKLFGSQRSYLYEVAICCIVKDEEYLPEWVEYHLTIGVTQPGEKCGESRGQAEGEREEQSQGRPRQQVLDAGNSAAGSHQFPLPDLPGGEVHYVRFRIRPCLPRGFHGWLEAYR